MNKFKYIEDKVYSPNEFIFHLEEDTDVDSIVVYVCPELYWRTEGYMFDQTCFIEGFKLSELQEATFESPDDMETTRKKLLDLGLREDPAFGKFIRNCIG